MVPVLALGVRHHHRLPVPVTTHILTLLRLLNIGVDQAAVAFLHHHRGELVAIIRINRMDPILLRMHTDRIRMGIHHSKAGHHKQHKAGHHKQHKAGHHKHMAGIQAFMQQHRNWGLIRVLGLLSLLRWDWHLQELGFLLWLLHWDWELVLRLGLQRTLRLLRHVIRLLQEDWVGLLMLLEDFLTLLPVYTTVDDLSLIHI